MIRCGRPLWTPSRAEPVTDSLVYRYDPAASPTGRAADEGTFSLDRGRPIGTTALGVPASGLIRAG